MVGNAQASKVKHGKASSGNTSIGGSAPIGSNASTSHGGAQGKHGTSGKMI